jgi:hypothetical protein
MQLILLDGEEINLEKVNKCIVLSQRENRKGGGMDKKLDLLEAYGSTFRDLINATVQPTKLTIREVLRMSKDEDWAFLRSAMDIIGDVCLAIDSFLMFGLNGPTKYDEVGERYLRLYGILSATYIQQQAVLKLYQLMSVPPTLKEGVSMINGLEIRMLRHKLCSHSTDYYDESSKTLQTYVPIRVDLDDFCCGYANNDNTGEQHLVDLKKAINDHLNTMVEMLDRVLDKAIKTLYSGQETNKNCLEFSEKLENLRVIGKGGLLTKLLDGTKFIITMG